MLLTRLLEWPVLSAAFSPHENSSFLKRESMTNRQILAALRLKSVSLRDGSVGNPTGRESWVRLKDVEAALTSASAALGRSAARSGRLARPKRSAR